MALLNANYEFLYVKPSTQRTKNGMNFVFVEGDPSPLHKHLMKPFPQKNVTLE